MLVSSKSHFKTKEETRESILLLQGTRLLPSNHIEWPTSSSTFFWFHLALVYMCTCQHTNTPHTHMCTCNSNSLQFEFTYMFPLSNHNYEIGSYFLILLFLMFHGTHSSRYGMVIALLNFQYPHLHKNFKMLGPINILLWREKRLFNEAPPLS